MGQRSVSKVKPILYMLGKGGISVLQTAIFLFRFFLFRFLSICFVSFRSVPFRFDLFRFDLFRFVPVSFRTLQGPSFQHIE